MKYKRNINSNPFQYPHILLKPYLISAHIYTEYGHSQGMSQIYRCCTFSKYQHSPLAGIPLDLLCSSRKSSPEHKMMFLSTDIVRQTIHKEHWKIMTTGKVKLAHLKKLSKKPKKTHKKQLIFKRGNGQHK